MVRLLLVVGIVAALFYIYAAVDCILFDRTRARALPKAAWVVVVLIFPIIGGILWFAFGRGRRGIAGRARTGAPDDDPEFLSSLGGVGVKERPGGPSAEDKKAQDERIKELERELAELDDKKKKGENGEPGHRDA